MKILYLANPHSIHDLKWISFFSQQADYECFLVPYENDGKLESAREKATALNIKVMPPVHSFMITHFWQWLPDLFRLRRIIRREGIDLIHIIYADPTSQWALFKSFLGVPIVLAALGSDVLLGIPETLRRETFMRKLIAPIYDRAFLQLDHISGTSESQLIKAREFSQGKVKTDIIRIAANVEAFDQPTADYFPEELSDKPYVIFPRVMRPVYNHEFSLKGIAHLPDEVKSRYSFVFLDAASSYTDYVQKVKDHMAELPDVDIRFMDAVTQPVLFELLKRASLIVMNPHSDGSPVTAMEAMLASTPLILGPLPYDRDLFGKGVVILKEWSETELAGEMEAILTGRKQLDIKEARRVVETQGNYTIEMTRLAGIYQKVTRRTSDHV